MRRLLALLVLLAFGAVGLYYWKVRPEGMSSIRLGAVSRHLADAKTAAQVKTALGLSRTLKPYRLRAAIEQGVATLRGAVPSEELKRLAESRVAAVPGVRQVVNHIEVRRSAASREEKGRTLGEALDDRALEVQVKLALSLRRELEGTDIDVAVRRRAVTLSGEVERPEQRRAAVETAGDVSGAEGVTDRLRVRSGETASPAAAAEREVNSSPHLARYRLTVREVEGRLVLEGRVRTGAEKDLAELLAQQGAGRAVDNALQVER